MTHGDGDGRAEYHCTDPDCTFTTTRPGPLASHIKYKHGKVSEPLPGRKPEGGDENVNHLGQAYLPWAKASTRLGVGQRMIKMARPICDICKGPLGWWENCPHDPYISAVENKLQVPIYEDAPGQPGVKIIQEMQEQVYWEPRPNLHEVAVSLRVNGGRGYQRARHKGEILPVDIRSPAFPNGVAPICQFRGCWNQHGLKEYQPGVFCRKIEAQLVWYDQEGKPIEYEHPLDRESQNKRRAMLAMAEIN